MFCVQETRWKGSKARDICGGYKLFYFGVSKERNCVGIILKQNYIKSVLEVNRILDRVMSMKLEIEGILTNIVSAYAHP